MSDTDNSNDNKNDDMRDEKRPMNPLPTNGPSRTPFIVWLVILVVVPLLIVMSQDSKDEVEMGMANFIGKLDAGLIEECTIVRNTSTGEVYAVGKYREDKDERKKNFNLEIFFTDALEDKLNKSNVSWEVKTETESFTHLVIQVVPFLIILLILYFFFSRQVRSAGRGAMSFGKSRARLTTGGPKVTFKDVAGLDEGKEEVEEIVQYLKDPAKVQELGGRVPKGILMVGPPGTGKTLLARAIAGEADAPFYSISGSDFVEMFVGVGASRVRDMFEQAKKNPPCLIFIDEIDAVGRARFAGIGGGNDEREQTLNALLVEMDGFEPNSGVVVIAATNRPDVLDKALLRPGRFDRQVNIDLPDRKGREAILAVHARKIRLADDVDLKVIARGTPGFSGADLANLLNESALIAAKFNKKAVTMAELEEAKEKVCWGRERKSRKFSEKERRNTAVHEAGHALVGLHLEDATPLHKVTIIPRGNAYLGATMYLPEDDTYCRDIPALKAELAVSMGGRVAEQIVFESFTTGAAGDIRNATELAKKMVCQWGMSDELGPLDYAANRQNVYAAGDSTKGDNHGEEISNKIDREVRKLVDVAVETATQILTENREQLDKFTEALLEKETMDVVEICDLLGFDKSKLDHERFFISSDESNKESSEEVEVEQEAAAENSAEVNASEEPESE